MTDNSKNMTLEEKVVQHIKTTSLMLLVEDEDAITKLTRRAIEEALFKNRHEGEGYNIKEKDSPVVEAAREIAKAALEKVMQEEIGRIKADPRAMQEIRTAVVMLLPKVLDSTVRELYGTIKDDAAMTALNKLREIANGQR